MDRYSFALCARMCVNICVLQSACSHSSILRTYNHAKLCTYVYSCSRMYITTVCGIHPSRTVHLEKASSKVENAANLGIKRTLTFQTKELTVDYILYLDHSGRSEGICRSMTQGSEGNKLGAIARVHEDTTIHMHYTLTQCPAMKMSRANLSAWSRRTLTSCAPKE